MRYAYLTLLLLGLLSTPLAPAADSQNHQVVDGVSVYLGVLPAEMILGHPRGHPESEMHGGPPTGERRYHVVVAAFDAATGKRIADARVTATVSQLGLSGTKKKLEPMTIAGTISYGNYFTLPGPGPYRIEVEIRSPRTPRPLRLSFDYAFART